MSMACSFCSRPRLPLLSLVRDPWHLPLRGNIDILHVAGNTAKYYYQGQNKKKIPKEMKVTYAFPDALSTAACAIGYLHSFTCSR